MWSEKRDNGVLYVERYTHPLTEKKIKLSVKYPKDTARNRREAKEVLDNRFRSRLGALKKNDHKVTLHELIEHYLKYQERAVKSSTYSRNMFALRTIESILGGSVIVDLLTAGYVKEKFQERDEKNGTINERVKRLKALLRWGYDNDYVSSIDWLSKLKALPDEEKREKIENKFLERDELRAVLDSMAVTCEHWQLLAEFQALTGMRAGECIALEKKDVDLKRKVITVNKTLNARYRTIGTPKTATSIREVSIQPQLEILIRRINVYMMRQALECGYNTRLFFSDVNGDYVEYYAYNKCLKENIERITGKHGTTHILRHTHVALLAENGVTLDVISRRLGHRDSNITRDVYFHCTERLKQRDAEIISKVDII